ncbi:hypothetical protein QJS66_22665 [Kocuria rhizophila]|nr:hypothetical protein QJS66_22665 [Kocuria rhizophila]
MAADVDVNTAQWIGSDEVRDHGAVPGQQRPAPPVLGVGDLLEDLPSLYRRHVHHGRHGLPPLTAPRTKLYTLTGSSWALQKRGCHGHLLRGVTAPGPDTTGTTGVGTAQRRSGLVVPEPSGWTGRMTADRTGPPPRSAASTPGTWASPRLPERGQYRPRALPPARARVQRHRRAPMVCRHHCRARPRFSAGSRPAPPPAPPRPDADAAGEVRGAGPSHRSGSPPAPGRAGPRGRPPRRLACTGRGTVPPRRVRCGSLVVRRAARAVRAVPLHRHPRQAPPRRRRRGTGESASRRGVRDAARGVPAGVQERWSHRSGPRPRGSCSGRPRRRGAGREGARPRPAAVGARAHERPRASSSAVDPVACLLHAAALPPGTRATPRAAPQGRHGLRRARSAEGQGEEAAVRAVRA